MIEDEQDRQAFEPPYRWIAEQYNRRKNNEFSSAPVWWYTDYKEAVKWFPNHRTDTVLIKAEVPDKLVLLHDADLWERGPFMQCHLGWLGHAMEATDDWQGTKYPELFNKVWDAYKNNRASVEQTWENVFNISKTNPPERIHGTTQFLSLDWLEPRQLKQSSEEILEMEM